MVSATSRRSARLCPRRTWPTKYVCSERSETAAGFSVLDLEREQTRRGASRSHRTDLHHIRANPRPKNPGTQEPKNHTGTPFPKGRAPVRPSPRPKPVYAATQHNARGPSRHTLNKLSPYRGSKLRHQLNQRPQMPDLFVGDGAASPVGSWEQKVRERKGRARRGARARS